MSRYGSRRSQGYGRLQSSEGYSKFSDEDAVSSSDERSEFELRRQKNKQKSNAETVFIERVVEEGDTLQKLSLQYSIPVSELKRANVLMADQDFFALKVLKIPVKKYSQLEEILTVGKACDNSQGLVNVGSPPEIWESIEDLGHYLPPSTSSNAPTLHNPHESADAKNSASIKNFLENVDLSLEKAKCSLNGSSETRKSIEASISRDRNDPIGYSNGDMYNIPSYRAESRWYSSIRHFILVIFFPAAVLLLFVGLVVLITRWRSDTSHTNPHEH